ncbi:retron Ec48 family effector membrane protein [Pseudomonas aeruginosa]|nr:retron Ec48 family effector membrane protein [Pseudomonas aeruginosa]QYE82764.1 retron Ec48 family effector membrane protein [Pseudomonas aeruginosa]
MKPIKILLCILSIIFAGLILACFPAYDVVSKNKLYFCFSSGCFNTASELFAESLSIVKNSALIAAYVAALVGSYIGLKTFKETRDRDAYTRHTGNISIFKAGLEKILPGSVLNADSLNINKFYMCIFKGSRSGDISVSDGYIQIVKGLKNCVELTSAQYGGDSHGAAGVRIEHLNEMLALLDAVGIIIEEPDIGRLIELESGIFEFLDKVNSRLTDVEIKLSNLRRDYSVHSF